MNRFRSEAWGFVLAGGASSRMGADKALERMGGQTLLERARSRLQEVCATVLIVGDPQKYATFGLTVADLLPGNGPLGGIHAALTASESEYNVILAVDMPMVSPALLNLLLERAAATDRWCVAPRAAGRLHPLVGVYRRTGLPLIESALEEGRLSVVALLEPFVEVVSEEELMAGGVLASELANANNLAELDRLRAYSGS